MSLADTTTTIHPDAFELAALLRPAWPVIGAELVTSGVPLCEGEGGAGEEGGGGEGEGGGSGEGEGGEGGPGGQTQTFDREYVEKLRRENAAARKARQDLEVKVKEFEERDKSETQKLQEAKAAAEARAEQAEKAALRLKVGQKKGLAPEIAELLNGDDEKAMGEHADKLIKAGVKAGGNGTTSLDGGAREGQEPKPGDMDAAIRRAAGRA